MGIFGSADDLVAMAAFLSLDLLGIHAPPVMVCLTHKIPDTLRTGATMMQALGILPDIIDRCQNHVMAGSRVRWHYLHHWFSEEKKAAWDKLGQRIDNILAQTGTA